VIRVVLNDAQWQRIAPLLPGKEGDPGRSGEDNRRFVEAVLWIVRAGTPWRDLPDAFGKWGSVWKRFRRWTLKGVFEQIFAALSEDPDFEYALIDGTIVKVHRHGVGAKGDSKSGHRPVAWRADHQARRSRRCAGQSGALCLAARPASRQHRRRAAHHGCRF
jgi:transposase